MKHMELYPADLPLTLGLSQVLDTISTYAIGKKAREYVRDLKPVCEFAEILKRLDETAEFLNASGSFMLSVYPEPETELSILRVSNGVLSPLQCLQLRKLVSLANELIGWFEERADLYPVLLQKIQPNEKDRMLGEYIDEVVEKDGIVKDDASPELFNIRKDLQEKRRQADRVYKAHIQRLRKAGQLADIEESFVNGRRVLAVLSEFKREVKGILLGQSASGKISYIEPQNLVVLNNERLALEEEEQKEVYKILKVLSDTLRPFRKILQAYYQLLVDFDFLNARTRFAKELPAQRPVLSEGNDLFHWIDAAHPLLLMQQKESGIPTIPFTCHFEQERRIMVISGPNAGGKSITLKTMGLLQIMLQCGLYITASSKSRLGIVNKLYGDIGDNQSIEDGLSTYSSRLQKMKYFLEHAGPDTLFLIDEFGTGSDPDMGGALAEVILNKLNDKACKGIVTTHFTNLKLLANHREGIFNACMLFNSRSLKPLYKLQTGEPGSSFTFEVASKTGLPKDLIDEAKGKLSNEKVKMDRLLNQLQLEKNNLEKLKRDLQKQLSKTTAAKREFSQLNEELETNLQKHKENKLEKQRLADYGRKLHQLTREWTENKNKKEVISKFVKLAGYEQSVRKAQEEFEKTEAYKEQLISQVRTKISVGSKVRLLKSKETGIVRSIKGDRAIILFGKVEMNIGLEKLNVVG